MLVFLIIVWQWKSFSHVQLFATPWSIQSLEFSRPEYWSGFPSPGDVPFSRRRSLLQGIFPTQGLNPDLPNCRQILYQLSHQGSPRILEWVVYPFSRPSSQARNWTGVSCFADRFFTSWATSLSILVSSVAQSCLTLCDPMNRSTPGLPVHHQLPEFTQTHVYRVGDAIQPSPLSSPSPPAPNPFQHQGLFQWVNSSHEVAKVLNGLYVHKLYMHI